MEYFIGSPREFDRIHSRLYIVSKLAYTSGVLFHSTNILIFLVIDAYYMALINIGSVVIYILSTYITVVKKDIKLPFIMAVLFELPAHAALATLAFGINCAWFTWAMFPPVVVFWVPFFSWRTRSAISVTHTLIFGTIGFIGIAFEPFYSVPFGWTAFFMLFNTLGPAFTFAVIFALNQWVAVNAEDALEAEYDRSETLLRNILPDPIALRLKASPNEVIADRHEEVTVLFADIVNFTPRATRSPPEEIVRFLNRVFSEYDALVEKHGLEKIKTVGDAYMVVAGIPNNREDGVAVMAEFALEMMERTKQLSKEIKDGIELRVGIHTGDAVAGVIGTSKFAYDIWGDTVNTAARMESFGIPNRIQVTETVKFALLSRYEFEERGVVEVKGRGSMRLHFLVGRST